jgi:hypothetical protein
MLWDTIQENDPEMSSALENLLRKISPSYEVRKEASQSPGSAVFGHFSINIRRAHTAS